ncbi:MAG TPA: TolC family protein, partial [Ferruginibacter sp.]|nr:TolC family protein [Ferruginibacter sp.]
MKKLLKYGLFLLPLFGGTMETKAQKVNSFTLKQAVDYAMQHSVQVKNAIIDVLMQQQTNRDITSIALPQISGSAGITDYLDIPTTLVPAQFFGGNPGEFAPVKFGTKWNSNVSLAVSQLIFDGQVFIALKARNGTIDFQKALQGVTEENIKANIYKIYYQLVLSKTQTELLDSNINLAKKLHRDMSIMFDNGFVEKLDVDKASVLLVNLQTEKMKVENMIANGYAGLKLLMGMPVRDSLVLTDKLTDDQIKEGVLESSQYNYNDRKEYQVMTITNKLNGLNVRRYKLSQ